jgi:hypothetical protein
VRATAVAVAIALCALPGCATVFAGGPDAVPITTNPPGAYVYLNGQVVGQTPLVVKLDRGASSADIRIYYPGFQPVQIQRYKSFNWWTIGDFPILAMIFPIVIDIATGNWQRYDDDAILLGLTPGQAAPPYGIQPQLPPQQGPQEPPPATRPQQLPPPPPVPPPAR